MSRTSPRPCIRRAWPWDGGGAGSAYAGHPACGAPWGGTRAGRDRGGGAGTCTSPGQRCAPPSLPPRETPHAAALGDRLSGMSAQRPVARHSGWGPVPRRRGLRHARSRSDVGLAPAGWAACRAAVGRAPAQARCRRCACVVPRHAGNGGPSPGSLRDAGSTRSATQVARRRHGSGTAPAGA